MEAVCPAVWWWGTLTNLRTCGLEGVLIVVAVIKIIVIATYMLLLVYIKVLVSSGDHMTFLV